MDFDFDFIHKSSTNITTNKMLGTNFNEPMASEAEIKARYKHLILTGAICGLTILSIFALALGIPAIVIGFKDEPACVNTYEGISFTFVTWLRVFGLVIISSTILLVVTAISAIQLESKLLAGTAVVLRWLFRVFGLVWFVIGTVLYFKTVDENCGDEPIGEYGLAWFIIYIVGIAMDLYSHKK